MQQYSNKRFKIQAFEQRKDTKEWVGGSQKLGKVNPEDVYREKESGVFQRVQRERISKRHIELELVCQKAKIKNNTK